MGAVTKAAGWENDLFHNHAGNQLRVGPAPERVPAGHGQAEQPQSLLLSHQQYHYRYPLIQYRVIEGKAALLGFNEGADALRSWLLQGKRSISIAGSASTLEIRGMEEHSHRLRMLPHWKYYRLMDYQPFHAENYKKWQAAEDLGARIQLLQQCLTGQLLSVATGLDWRIPERLEVRPMHIRSTREVRTHKSSRLAFNLIYKCNLDLPAGIAVGRAVSHGFGVQVPTRASHHEEML